MHPTYQVLLRVERRRRKMWKEIVATDANIGTRRVSRLMLLLLLLFTDLIFKDMLTYVDG